MALILLAERPATAVGSIREAVPATSSSPWVSTPIDVEFDSTGLLYVLDVDTRFNGVFVKNSLVRDDLASGSREALWVTTSNLVPTGPKGIALDVDDQLFSRTGAET